MIIEHFLAWMHTAPVDKRAQAAAALAKAYLVSELDYNERASAETALTVLLDDAAANVRFALADALANSKNSPRHIMMGLANDTPEISSLVLSRSPAFCDGELVDMIATGPIHQQIAISCRSNISSALCGAIAEVGRVESCVGLLMNSSALLSNRVITRLCNRLGDDSEIRKLLLARSDINLEQRMILLNKLGAVLGDFVNRRNWMRESRVEKTVAESMERCAIVCASSAVESDISDLVKKMITSRKMTTSFLLRSLCMGNITLFCEALAQLAKIPAVRIETMISQQRIAAFKATYLKAGMPIAAFEVFATALNVWQQLLSENEWISRARMPYLVTRQVMAIYQGKGEEIVDELLVTLRKISADLAREDARTHILEISRKQSEDKRLEHLAQMDTVASRRAPSAETTTLLDADFEKRMEATLAAAFENDVIEITAHNIQIPTSASNDASPNRVPIDRAEAENAQLVDNGNLSQAA